MTLPPAAGAALSLLSCTVGMFNATPRGHEADRYAHARTWRRVAGGKCSAKADVFPCGPRGSERSAQDVEGVGSRKAAGGSGGGTGEERNPAGVSGQVGELTYEHG